MTTQRDARRGAATLVADSWSLLVDKWHASAIRALALHNNTTDGVCGCCGDVWPCGTASSASFALEVHAYA